MTYIKRFVPNEPLPTKENTLFPDLDVEQVGNNIFRAGYSLGIKLSEECVEKIVDYCRNNEASSYTNPHIDCELINDIAFDPKVVEIARKYLEIEPILYGTRIYWTFPKQKDTNGNHSSVEKKDFHYDVGDFKSLTLFIYLTDVGIDSSPHRLIEDTQNKTLKQLLQPTMSYEAAEKIYGGRIKTITGKAGTGFFEDITTYHQQPAGTKPRLVLTSIYSFYRNP